MHGYPHHFEVTVASRDGAPVVIRPIGPADGPLIEAFFAHLSPRSVYMRFFAPLKRISPAMLERLTHIDYEAHIALKALAAGDGPAEMLGVARVITTAPGKAEFSVVVRDDWQGRGVGAALLQTGLDIAAARGIDRVWGLVLAENTQMLKLGRRLGFTARIAGGAEYELTIQLPAAGDPAGNGKAESGA